MGQQWHAAGANTAAGAGAAMQAAPTRTGAGAAVVAAGVVLGRCLCQQSCCCLHHLWQPLQQS